MKKVVFILVVPFLIFAALIRCGNFSEVNTTSVDHKEDSCCSKEITETTSGTSEITCPKCGHKKTETLPEDLCKVKYTCEKCKTDLFPKEGDCCVFCTYGTHKCPSKQE